MIRESKIKIARGSSISVVLSICCVYINMDMSSSSLLDYINTLCPSLCLLLFSRLHQLTTTIQLLFSSLLSASTSQHQTPAGNMHFAPTIFSSLALVLCADGAPVGEGDNGMLATFQAWITDCGDTNGVRNNFCYLFQPVVGVGKPFVLHDCTLVLNPPNRPKSGCLWLTLLIAYDRPPPVAA